MEQSDNGNIIFKRKTDIEILIRIDERTKTLCEKIDKIDEKIKDYKEIKTDVSWLKKFFWILATGVVGGLITSTFAIMLRR